MLNSKAIECALRSVGVKEEGNNRGKYVAQYLKAVGLPPGNPWCAAFVYYKVRQAAEETKLPFAWPKTGLVQAVVNWANKVGGVLTTPVVNATFVIYYSSLKRYAHIGFIIAVERRNDGLWIETVEGNSNNDGSREGTEVVRKWRKWKPSVMRCIPIR